MNKKIQKIIKLIRLELLVELFFHSRINKLRIQEQNFKNRIVSVISKI